MNNNVNLKINPYIDKLFLVICLVLTLVSWTISIYVNKENQESQFNFESQKIKEDLELHFTSHLDTLYSIRGLFDSSDSVTRDEFVTFVKNLDLDSKELEFVRISYTSIVNTADIDKFDKSIKEEGYNNYKSSLVSNQEYQYIVNYITDSVGNNYPPTGINLWSGPERIEAIDYTVKNHKPSISSPVDIRTVPEELSKGLIVNVPVYKDSKLVGLLNGVVSTKYISDHFKEYLDTVSKIELIDGQTVIFKLDDIKKNESNFLTLKYNLNFFNKEDYLLEIQKLKINTFLLLVPNLILVSGIIISILMYIVMYSIIRTNKKAYEIAQFMTSDLSKYKLAIDNTDSHVIITDVDGKVTYANKSAEKMTGYSHSEIIGNTPSLWGRQMTAEFYKKLWHVIKVEKKVFSGEITNKRKNGELYIAYASISPIIDDSGNLIGFVGIEEDITENKKTTDELKKMNELMINRELKMIDLKKQLESKKLYDN